MYPALAAAFTRRFVTSRVFRRAGGFSFDPRYIILPRIKAFLGYITAVLLSPPTKVLIPEDQCLVHIDVSHIVCV